MVTSISSRPNDGPPEALGDDQRLGGRVAAGVEPGLAVEAGGGHDQRVAVPASARVAQPRRVRVLDQRTPVHLDLPPLPEGLVQDHHRAGQRDELPGRRRECDLRHALRQAVGVGLDPGVHAGRAAPCRAPRPTAASARHRESRTRGRGSSGDRRRSRYPKSRACRRHRAVPAPPGWAGHRPRAACQAEPGAPTARCRVDISREPPQRENR